jgi:hypothetical protein
MAKLESFKSVPTDPLPGDPLMFTNEEYVFFPLTKLKLGPKPLN